jgi:hypothetical protein
VRGKGKIRLGSGGPTARRKRREQAGLGGPPGHRAVGKKVSFILFYFFPFFSYINLFSKAILKMDFEFKSNQIKPKPHHTIKQNPH